MSAPLSLSYPPSNSIVYSVHRKSGLPDERVYADRQFARNFAHIREEIHRRNAQNSKQSANDTTDNATADDANNDVVMTALDGDTAAATSDVPMTDDASALSAASIDTTTLSDSKSVNAIALSQLSFRIQRLMEAHFGRDAHFVYSRKLVKLPARMFRDFRGADGAQTVILHTALVARQIKPQLDFDIADDVALADALVDDYIALFDLIRQRLERAGHWRRPHIFIRSSDDGNVDELRAFVTSHDGTLSQSADAATHIVVVQSAAANGDTNTKTNNRGRRKRGARAETAVSASPVNKVEEDDAEYLRTLAVYGERAFVHWWYHPDSYDEWIPKSDVEGDEIDDNNDGDLRFVVSDRFLFDLERFNEWPNASDYDCLAEYPEYRVVNAEANNTYSLHFTYNGRTVLRKSAYLPADFRSARNKSSDTAALVIEERARVGGGGTGTVLNLSGGVESLSVDPTQFPYSGPLLARARIKAPFPLIVPAYAKWFDTAQIHAIERRANTLAHFFTSRVFRGADIYFECRNAIVNAYRANPRVYLTVTAARRFCAVDARSVERIHSFLGEWGIINYQSDAGTKPHTLHPNREHQNFHIHYANAAMIQPATATNAAGASSNTASVYPALTHLFDDRSVDRSLLRRTLYGGAIELESLNAAGPPDEADFCRVCLSDVSAEDDDANTFVLRSDIAYRICAQCYDDGRFPPRQSKADFRRRDDVSGTDQPAPMIVDGEHSASDVRRAWSRSETLALVDALTDIGDNDWDAVAARVGRSKAECVRHFIQMPIADNAIRNASTAATATSALFSDSIAPALSAPFVPFSDCRNPLITQIAFLASAVSPAVAAAAAQSAIQAMTAQTGAHAFTHRSVQTPFGDGQIIRVREDDGIALVQLSWAKAFIHRDHIAFLNAKSVAELSAVALAAAAAKCADLSVEEERKQLRIVAQIVAAQMSNINSKLAAINNIDAILNARHNALNKQTQTILKHKVQILNAMTSTNAPTAVAADTAAHMQT